MRFSAVLQAAIQDGTVVLPENLQTDFNDIHCYRGVKVKEQETSRQLCRDDFNSQMEQRQFNCCLAVDPSKWEDYSCSCFKDIDELKISFHLPRKNKGIAEGQITKTFGACIEDDSSHVHWFLYEGADPSPNFQIIEVYHE